LLVLLLDDDATLGSDQVTDCLLAATLGSEWAMIACLLHGDDAGDY